MPARQFMNRVPPQRIRTLLALFALALALPLLALAYFALNRMAGLEEREIERRAVQVAEDLAGDVDRELDRATTTLETLATSAALARGDVAALPHTADPQTAQRVFDSKQRQISDLFVDSISHQPVINVEVPVLTADTVRYVLIM